MLTLAEEFLLLALDDNTGRKLVDSTQMSAALAGAAIVELTLDQAMRMTETSDSGREPGRLVATDRRPADARLASLLTVADGHKPKDAVAKVAGFGSWRSQAKNLQDALLKDLAEQGYLTEVRGKVLGIFSTTAWKPHNLVAKGDIVRRVRTAIVDEATPDDRTAALISIVHAVDLLPKLCPSLDKRTVKHRGQAITDSEWGGPAVRKAVQQVQAATLAIIVTTTTITTATS